MCEYCEGISNPINFPTKYTFEDGSIASVQDGFKINLKDKTLEIFEKNVETNEYITTFSREIEYCPFCGISLDEMKKILEHKEIYESKSNKEAIIHYCQNLKTHDIDYLDNALNNLNVLQNNKPIENLEGCPNNYGLDYYQGLCFDIDTEKMSNKEKIELCNECWKKALE